MRCFFSMLKFLSGGWKKNNGPKWWKFLSVAPYISETIYYMIFSYGAHTCIKGQYLQAFFSFYFFKILIFRIIRGRGGGVKRAKNDPKWQEILPVSLCISGTIHDCDFWYTFVKWWYLQQINSFFKILIFGFLGW